MKPTSSETDLPVRLVAEAGRMSERWQRQTADLAVVQENDRTALLCIPDTTTVDT